MGTQQQQTLDLGMCRTQLLSQAPLGKSNLHSGLGCFCYLHGRSRCLEHGAPWAELKGRVTVISCRTMGWEHKSPGENPKYLTLTLRLNKVSQRLRISLWEIKQNGLLEREINCGQQVMTGYGKVMRE